MYIFVNCARGVYCYKCQTKLDRFDVEVRRAGKSYHFICFAQKQNYLMNAPDDVWVEDELENKYYLDKMNKYFLYCWIGILNKPLPSKPIEKLKVSELKLELKKRNQIKLSKLRKEELKNRLLRSEENTYELQ